MRDVASLLLSRVTSVRLWLAIVAMVACDFPSGPARFPTWREFTARSAQTCGVDSGGDVRCIGTMWTPLFGGTKVLDSPNPVPLSHSVRLSSLVSGSGFVCGLDGNRRAWCAGLNHLGQLGSGAGAATLDFQAVAGDYSWTSLAAGHSHVCGITSEGETLCWGNAFRGALGNGTDTGIAPGPTAVSGAPAFVSLAAGEGFTCALTVAGELWCWGVGDVGQLADGSVGFPVTATQPIRAATDVTFESIAAASSFACGLSSERVYCWGGNLHGQLGNGTMTESRVPTPVAGAVAFRQLALGDTFVCGIARGGRPHCWGSNRYGQFGDGSLSGSAVPRAVHLDSVFTQLSAGTEHTCGLTPRRQMFCWGVGFESERLVVRRRPYPVWQ